MRKKKITRPAVWLLCATLAIGTHTVVAETSSAQESVSLQETQAETASLAQDGTAAAAETSMAETLPPVANVDALIEAIDSSKPLRSAVLDALDAYNNLTAAQKMQVADYAKLRAAGIAIGEIQETKAPENEEKPDTVTRKSGNKFSFRITSYLKQVTLSIRYTTDTDGDGKMEAPKLTITDPGGNTVTVPADSAAETTVNTALGEARVMRSATAAQFDILQSSEGVWTVRTSNQVTFILSDYENGEKEEFEEQEGPAHIVDQMTPEEKPAPNYMPLIAMGAFLLVSIVGLVLVAMMPKLKKRKNGGQTSKAKPSKKKKGDTDEEIKPMTDEEELDEIRKEWEKMRPQYRDKEDSDRDQGKDKDADKGKRGRAAATSQTPANDERLSVTMEDLENDDSIEEMNDEDDDDGFFGKPRF